MLATRTPTDRAATAAVVVLAIVADLAVVVVAAVLIERLGHRSGSDGRLGRHHSPMRSQLEVLRVYTTELHAVLRLVGTVEADTDRVQRTLAHITVDAVELVAEAVGDVDVDRAACITAVHSSIVGKQSYQPYHLLLSSGVKWTRSTKVLVTYIISHYRAFVKESPRGRATRSAKTVRAV